MSWLLPIAVDYSNGRLSVITDIRYGVIPVGPGRSVGGSVEGGAVAIWLLGPAPNTRARYGRPTGVGHAIYPQYWASAYRIPGWKVATLPLWLVSALCLAWPVTSFIVARRRRKARGFEVEPKADSTPLPRAGELPIGE